MSKNISSNFILGRMNKSVDERLVPKGEYVDARNVRLGSTETTEIGAVENSKGNTRLTTLSYAGSTLSGSAVCIGAFQEGISETMYWFVHDPANTSSPTGKVDMIVSYNTNNNVITYHVTSISVLNFSPKHLITGVNKIDDLLFFTDNLNPPRCVNVKRNYDDPSAGVDGIEEEDVSVIKKPPGYEKSVGGYKPLTAPDVELTILPGDENYIVNKFISFAYRYRYEDGEYSATSLFTQPAFQPGLFRFDSLNFYNAGMVNAYNAAFVSFSTGSKRVKQVDLLYKPANTNTIYVIERFNKQDNGWSDNTTQTITFDNSKIYTVLGSDELLRLYDNVPQKAQAQTIQGNRLIYGNYVDQFDIQSSPGTDIKISYSTSPVSESVSGVDLDEPFTFNGITYTINPSSNPNVPDAKISFDLSAVETPIAAGTTFGFNLELVSSPNFTPQGNGPDIDLSFQQNGGIPFDISFSFTATQVYNSVSAMINSLEFKEAIGAESIGNYQPIATLDEGVTLTDRFNQAIQSPIPGTDLELINSSITGNCGDPTVVGNCVQQGFLFGTSGGGTSFNLQVPAVQYYYEDPVSGDVSNQWEYFEFNAFGSSAGYTKTENTLSLHSNRNYETGIVYMDDYGRASTVLVSKDNTVNFGPETSILQNKIRATVSSPPPYWAKKFKFVVKPSKGEYNTLYVTTFYKDDNAPQIVYFKLEGDSTSFVKAGDVLYVKSDTEGVVNSVTEVVVLEVKAFAGGEVPGNADSLPGLYMIAKPGGFATSEIPFANLNFGIEKIKSYSTSCSTNKTVNVPLFYNDGVSNVNVDLPAGSKVRIYINNWRGHKNDTCDAKQYKFDETFTVTQDYPNFYEWMIGDGIDPSTGYTNETSATWFDNGGTGPYSSNASNPCSCFHTKLFIYENGSGLQYFYNRGCIPKCANWNGTDKRPGNTELLIEVQRTGGLLIFETEPTEADPNLFYDASETYDIVNGNHMSGTRDGDQDQDLSADVAFKALLSNADCYSFGNGVESYKIQDRWVAMPFQLGERVLAVSNQDFAQADRFNSLTYSGVIQPSSNVNNLNEFNLGLVNYKDLESSFGPVMKLHSRETDILVLQEDRISYVLSKKNVITDSTGGGAIASVPEVLGTQVARIEEYGISFNPESFVSWGSKMFFTDVKRSAVLMLQGASANSDQLTVISDMGMRSWFRDQFIEQSNTQKLGGYDPYMDEFVLSTNNREIPSEDNIVGCGTEVEQSDAAGALSYSVDLGSSVGEIDFDYNVSEGSVDIIFSWNGTNYGPSDPVSGGGTLSFDKTSASPNTVDVTITPAESTATYSATVKCPPVSEITVVQVVVNSQDVAGQFTHFGYNWSDGLTSSPSTNGLASLGLSIPSEYISSTGQRSVGTFPYDGVDLTMSIMKEGSDTFNFNESNNSFKYLSSNTLYTEEEVLDLLPLLNEITGSISNPSFGVYTNTVSALSIPSENQYLYLVWDLRSITSSSLCYDAISSDEACCGCSQDCKQAFFGPVEVTQSGACLTNTNSNGWSENSFYGENNIPTTGDICFSGTNCDGSTPLGAGYYVVGVSQPSPSPKQWVYVNSYGIVVENGTC